MGSDRASLVAAAPAQSRVPAPPTRDSAPAAEQALGNRDLKQFIAPARETSFVVEDDDGQPSANQMRRGEFLASVREAVVDAANKGLAPSGRTADDCPWIEYWLRHYEKRDAEHLNRSLREIAPETADAGTAGRAVTMIAARVRRSVDQYVRTGEISGIPDGFSPELPGGILGSLFGKLLFKRRPGGPVATAHDPQMVKTLLGAGQPLNGNHRSRMEQVFATGFAHVRVHNDSTGAGLSEQLQARAFTVGEHIAFAPGEYRPGTIAGDALLAHELAHTLQQQPGEPATSTEALESDADQSAVSAVTRLWTDYESGTPVPKRRTGLQLSRCSANKAAAKPPKTPQAPGAVEPEVDDTPPDPENSYWFQDPKKQVPQEEGEQTMDFSKKDKEEVKITSSAQTRLQVFVDRPKDYSKVGDINVRFAFPAAEMTSGKQSARLSSAKSAVLQALKSIVADIDALGGEAIEWENAAEKKEKLRIRKEKETQRARLMEVFKGYTASNPLNVYLAPETRKEIISGQFIPITAQVWVNMADVGDPAKLKTAFRLPFQHILGGPNPAMRGSDDPADMRHTMLHEGLHALLANSGASNEGVWKEAQTKMKIEGPEDAVKVFNDVVHGYILSQEELFAYNNEESLYGQQTGKQQGGKPLYETFMSGVDLFFTGKKVKFITVAKKINVAEKVDKKKVDWGITYKYPAAIKLEAGDKAVLDLLMTTWPLRSK